MEKVKQVYIDSRFRTTDSASNSDFKFNLKEPLELPDNTVCYVDDMSIPHTWRTIESHNTKLYICFKMQYPAGQEFAYNYDAFILTVPEGNYNGMNLASAIQELLHGFAITFNFEVVCHVARGTVTIEAKYEGMYSNNEFIIPTDFGVTTWISNTGNDHPWKNREGIVQTVDVNNIQSINGVLRNSDTQFIPIHLQYEFYRTYESGFLDLLNIHNINLHCPNLGHFNSIGVKGENSIIEQIPVSSSFGYLILDSIVALHEK